MLMSTEKDMLNSGDFTTSNKLPGSINVLTILTFIGCALGLIGAFYSYATADKTYKDMKELVNSGKLNDAPGWAKGMISADTLPMYEKLADNKMPIMILGIVGIALCFVGAMQMRKLKKQGYLLYVVGEILPIISTFIFVGAMAFKGFGLLVTIVPIVFILLYTVNRKYLVN